MTTLISDSSTLYSQAEARKQGIYTVPLNVIVDQKNYREFEDIQSSQLLKMIQENKIPSSSLPSIGEKIDLYNEIDDDIIDITMAKGLSSTYEAALTARESCDHPEKVTIVNARTLCGPHRLLVDTANAMLKAGKSREDVLTMLDASIPTEVSFLIPRDFSFLQRGGRISHLAAGVGGLLKLIPLMIKSEDGERIEKFDVFRTFKKCATSIAAYCKEKGMDSTYEFFVSHANNEEDALKMEAVLHKEFPEAKIVIYPLSPAFVTQGGPQCVAIQAIKICNE